MNGDSPIDRRTVLKATTAAGSLPLMGSVGSADGASAPSERYSLGTVLFVEIGMEQTGLTDSDYHTEDAAPHVVNGESVLSLRYAPTQAFREQNLVTTYRRRYHPGGTTFGGVTTPSIPVETGYDWHHQRGQFTEDGYEHPEMTVERTDGRAVTVTVNGGTTQRVDPDTETRFRLPEVTFTRERTRTVETSRPVLSIRNNGHVDLYGSTEARLFPVDTEKRWVEWRKRAFEDNPDVRTERSDPVFAAYPPNPKRP